MAQGTIQYNPFASFSPEKALRKHRHLTTDELQRLMNHAYPGKSSCVLSATCLSLAASLASAYAGYVQSGCFQLK